MKYEQISPVMRNFLGNREAFRRLGFSADDLFLSIQPSAELRGLFGVYLVLKTQGLTFTVFCGPATRFRAISRASEADEYKEICAHQHEISESDLERIWQECEIYNRKVDFLLALEQKGFRIPGPRSN